MVFPRLMLSAPISWQVQSEQLLQRHNWIRLVSENFESTFESFKTHVTGINMGSRNLSSSYQTFISKTAIRAYYTRAWMVVDSHHRGFVVRNEICMAKSTIKEVMHFDCLILFVLPKHLQCSKLFQAQIYHLFPHHWRQGCFSLHLRRRQVLAGLAMLIDSWTGWLIHVEGRIRCWPKNAKRSKITTREKSNCQAVTPFKSFR